MTLSFSTSEDVESHGLLRTAAREVELNELLTSEDMELHELLTATRDVKSVERVANRNKRHRVPEVVTVRDI